MQIQTQKERYLDQVAEISTGTTFRSRIEQNPYGNRIIQMRDISSNGELRIEEAFRVQAQTQNCLLKRGDLIFRSRGYSTTAILFDSDEKDVGIAAPLLRIRANREKVLPEYLLWYLNQPRTQQRLASLATKTTVSALNIKSLKEIPITLPDMETQKLIGEVYALSVREQKLLELIGKKRRVYTDESLTSLAEIQHQKTE